MTRHMLHRFVRAAFTVLLGLGATAYGAAPSINVTVSDASGNVAFRGPTKANAAFATGNLRPGNYVVQFDSNSAAVRRNRYLLVLSSGEKKVIADAVPGEKITAGGVAMRVAVGARSNITGQIANAMESSNTSNLMVRNGRRYSWATAQTGSNLGGHWVGEGLGDERNVIRWSSAEIQQIQARGDEGNLVNRVGQRTKFNGH